MQNYICLFVRVCSRIYAILLQVSGTNLMYNGQKVFLSGANAAWNNYGNDFGNGQYSGILETWMSEINAAGGNSFSQLLRWYR